MITFNSTDCLYDKFGKEAADRLINDPEMVAETDAKLARFKSICMSNLCETMKEDIKTRVETVHICINDGVGNQSQLCALAGLSPKTYRKYRDENKDMLEKEYQAHNEMMRTFCRNYLILKRLTAENEKQQHAIVC